MPWQPADATAKTKTASTPKLQRQWSEVANSVLGQGASEKSAIMQANGVVKKTAARKPRTGLGNVGINPY